MFSIFSLAARRPASFSSSGPKKSTSSPKTSSLTASPFNRANTSLVATQVRSFHVSSILGAVPKKKQSYSRSRQRNHSQTYQIKLKNWTHHHPCSRCKREILKHNVCHHCGWYKGVPIFLRSIRREEHKRQRAALKQQEEASAPSPSL